MNEVSKRSPLVKKTLFGILTLLTCVMIFFFSSQNGDESSEVSGGVVETICEFIVPEFSVFNGGEREYFVEDLQYAVRKCAHFCEYMLLSFFASGFFATFPKLSGHHYAAAVGFCFLYALTDELHQFFVPGRDSAFKDVMIDTGGALTAAMILFAASCVSVLITRKRIKKE